MEDPGDHAGDGRLAACARHTDGEGGGVEQGGEHVRPAHPFRADAERGGNVRHGIFHGGGSDDDLLGAGDAAAILREEADALAAEIVKLRGRAALVQGAVRALDDVALVEQDQRQRQHAGAADATEEIAILFGHAGCSITACGAAPLPLIRWLSACKIRLVRALRCGKGVTKESA